MLCKPNEQSHARFFNGTSLCVVGGNRTSDHVKETLRMSRTQSLNAWEDNGQREDTLSDCRTAISSTNNHSRNHRQIVPTVCEL
jgi:hypothetical protein